MSHPTLHVSAPRRPVCGVALVLHGGRSQSRVPTRATNLAVLRMAPFAWALRRAGRRHGLAVARLRYRVRGWNGAERSPVQDTRWALDELARRFPDVPVALVGHSMGGRTALYVAGHPNVRAVVGLAPWIESGDFERTAAGLPGRRLLFVHGDQDRMTDPRASAAYARRAEAVAASVDYEQIPGGTHAMLERPSAWHELAARFVVETLLRDPVGWSCDGAEHPGRAEEA